MTAAGTRRPRESCRFCDLGHRGHREGCPQVEIDAVTARALAAEARLSVPATSADTTRLHRIRARLLDLVPADGTMSLWDDVQRLDRALADAEARGRAHGLLAAAMWVLGEMDRYERAHGGLPVVKWPVLDRGYRLALGNMLAALAIIDPARRVVDDGSRFCAEEAPRGG